MAKILIRRGVFETNSSSVHSITICSKDDYSEWENGNLVYDRYNECLVPILELTAEQRSKIYNSHYDPENPIGEENNYDADYFYKEDYEDYFDNYDLYEVKDVVDGKEVIAFGYYGYN